MTKRLKGVNFSIGDLVLLFNSRLGLFPGKLKSKWTDPLCVTKVFPHNAVGLENKEGSRFLANEQRIKIYLEHAESSHEVANTYYLDEVSVIKGLGSCRDVISSDSS